MFTIGYDFVLQRRAGYRVRSNDFMELSNFAARITDKRHKNSVRLLAEQILRDYEVSLEMLIKQSRRAARVARNCSFDTGEKRIGEPANRGHDDHGPRCSGQPDN